MITSNKSGIYTITNLVDGKMYVGYAKNFCERSIRHINYLKINQHYNTHLQNAWNKYGEQSFLFEVLEECEERFLASQENYWANMLDVHNRIYGYNIASCNPEERKGKHSQESKDKISMAHKGKKQSVEQREAQRQRNIGKKLSEETKKKIGLAGKGRKMSDEAKRLIGIKNSEQRLTQERKDYLSRINTGKKHTEETKRKISETLKKRKILELNT